MKKLFLVVIFMSSAIFLHGCFNVNVFNALSKSVSEITYYSFEASDATFFVNFKTGLREDPYVGDGKSEKLIEFGVLTAQKTGEALKAHKASFRLIINEKEFKGSFEVNPFDNSFVFDIGVLVQQNSSVIAQITADKVEKEYVLNNVFSGNEISASEALKIAGKELSDSVKPFIKNGKLNAEVYVRIIDNVAIQNFKRHFYISVLTEDKKVFAIIIDATSREVLAKKT